jgi:hypothetical protein
MGLAHGANIVNDGLVFLVDPINPRSWTGPDSNTVNSLKGNNTGSIFNDTSGSYGNNDSFNFDATDDYIDFKTGFEVYSLSLWFKSNSATNNSSYNGCLISFDFNTYPNFKGIYLGDFGGFLTNELITIVPSGGTRCAYTDASATINTNWHSLCIVWDNANTQYKIYLDTVDVRNTNYGTPSVIQTTALIIGGRLLNGSVNAAFNGDIGPVQIYNRALSASEVLQNYNALKSRFGL